MKTLTKDTRRLDAWLLVAAIALSVIVRLLLRQSDVPIIINDEAVYPNLAKSILNTGELRFFGMSISYIYIAYPLVLLPLYLLPAAVNRYLAMGILGAVIMSSAAIPAYLLGKKLSGRNGAFCAALVTLLLPDLAYSTKSMNESLCYALFFWILFFAWKALGEAKYPMYFVVAVLSAVAFYTKPGYVAVGAVALALGVVFGLRDRQKKAWLSALSAALLLGVLIVLARLLITTVFNVDTDAAYYSAGVTDVTFSWGLLLAMVKYFLSYVTYFILSCGIVGAVIPVASMKKLDTDKRRLLIILLVSATATVIGALVSVHIDQYVNFTDNAMAQGRIHMRYLAAYIPVMFTFIFCPELSEKKSGGKKKHDSHGLIGTKWFIPAIILSVLFMLMRVNGQSLSGYYFDAYGLIIFRTLCNTLIGQLFTSALIALALFALLYHISKNSLSKKFLSVALIIFSSVLALESILAYIETGKNLKYMEDDAIELSVYTDGTDSVFLDDYSKTFMVDHYAYDVQSRDTVYYTTMGEFVTKCDEQSGAYAPFTVASIGEHVSYDKPLPDAENAYFVFPGRVSDIADFCDSAEIYTTGNEVYTAVKPASGERLFDSVFTGGATGTVVHGENSYITVYDPALLGEKSLSLRLLVSVDKGTDTLYVSSNSAASSYSVGTAEKWIDCTITIPDGYKWIDFTTSQGNVNILAYELTASE